MMISNLDESATAAPSSSIAMTSCSFIVLSPSVEGEYRCADEEQEACASRSSHKHAFSISLVQFEFLYKLHHLLEDAAIQGNEHMLYHDGFQVKWPGAQGPPLQEDRHSSLRRSILPLYYIYPTPNGKYRTAPKFRSCCQQFSIYGFPMPDRCCPICSSEYSYILWSRLSSSPHGPREASQTFCATV